ncbi:phosphoribosyltransferase [Candidatus Marsarchaeota archaeon]|nr:phosphoribosyltransferase [Candidatus Marsarchaeota archaeon]
MSDPGFPLEDRAEAGRRLASRLAGIRLERPVVLAIPRGGVVLGCEIAGALDAELDIVTPRKLKDEHDPELALGAVMHDGSVFLNEQVIAARAVGETYMRIEKEAEIRESMRRFNTYRGGRMYPSLEGRDVIIVDDGIATGATMFVAAGWVRKQEPRRMTIAVPVIPAEMLDSVRGQADELVYLGAPVLFSGIGQFYRNFPQVGDEDVMRMLNGFWDRERRK